MSSENVSDFWKWFDEIRGGLSIREIERNSRSPQGRISNHYRKSLPTLKVCLSIAKGLGIPEEDVLKLAGLLPSGMTTEKPLSPNAMLEEIYQAVKSGQLHRLTDERAEYLVGGGSGDDPTFKELLELRGG